MAKGGTVFRGQDGALYFIRDEVLEKCKVEGEYADRLNKMMEQSSGEVEGFSFEVQPTADIEGAIGYVEGDIMAKGGEVPEPAAAVRSTIMCPW